MTAVLSRPTAFDVCGELPTGTTVLEASAGTGKTFTIAALAARYVAEGHARLPELLLVTFGREATQELRERVRERLVSAERGLRDPVAARTGTDPVLALLADVPDAEAALRRRRLTAALAEFDAATIATTHQFCGQMLTTLGIAGDAADAVFVESVDDLVVEVVDDFYVRKFAAKGAGTPAFDRTEALRLARRAVGDPQARLEPAGASGTAGVRLSFASGRARGGRAPQAGARAAHLRRPHHSPARRTRRPRPRGGAAAAVPLPGGARRRVPGHGPAAVGHPAALRRASPAGPHRRPQAGDLRLPRRGRGELPRRRRAGRHPRHARPQLAQRRRAAARPGHRVRGRGARRPADRRAGGGVGPPGAAARGCARRRTAAGTGAAPRRAGVQRSRPGPHPGSPRPGRPRRGRGRRRAAHLGRDGGGRAAPARRRRGPRPHERPGHGDARLASPPSACPRCSRAPRACSAPPPRGSG